jgi:hypothetical protein
VDGVRLLGTLPHRPPSRRYIDVPTAIGIDHHSQYTHRKMGFTRSM